MTHTPVRRSLYGMKPASLLLALLLIPLSGVVRADLMLYPTRIVLEQDRNAAQVELINNGRESATYRISLVNRRMSESGEMLEIDTPRPDERFADPLLRYAPRQVTLAPGASQTIRMMVDLPPQLATGEYRSHLQFDRLPPPSGASSIESALTLGDRQIGVRLTPLIGASIPVIVRHGETSATVKLSDLRLDQHQESGLPLLMMVLHRSGNRSVYGDITVSFIPQHGPAQQVGGAGGVAVYTPNAVRRATLLLEPPPGLKLERGRLQVSYRERAEDGGRLLAEAQLALP